MNLAVVGSRSLDSIPEAKTCGEYLICRALLDEDFTGIVSGGAKGPDTWAENVVAYLNANRGIDKKCGLDRPELTKTIFKPDWQKYGRSAGFRRNKDIINAADLVMLLWDGWSRGTKHDLDICKEVKKPYELYIWNGDQFDIQP